MIGVKQTRFGGPGSALASVGNCFAACMASILELPLDYIEEHTPAAVGSERFDDGWIAGWQAFLATLNLRMVCFPYADEDREKVKGYAILNVESPNIARWPDGSVGMHAVVWKDGDVVWCPVQGKDVTFASLRPESLTILQVLDPSQLTGLRESAA